MTQALGLAVAHLRAVFQQPAFDPGEERRTVRIAAADSQTVLILPGVMARLAQETPGVEVRVEAYRHDVLDRLASGGLDLAFGISNAPLSAGAYSEIVYDDELALVIRRGHPAADGPWSIEDYGIYRHAGVALLGDGRSEIDALLAANGVTRQIALVTPHLMAALAAVAASDMVTTLSASLARRGMTKSGRPSNSTKPPMNHPGKPLTRSDRPVRPPPRLTPPIRALACAPANPGNPRRAGNHPRT